MDQESILEKFSKDPLCPDEELVENYAIPLKWLVENSCLINKRVMTSGGIYMKMYPCDPSIPKVKIVKAVTE